MARRANLLSRAGNHMINHKLGKMGNNPLDKETINLMAKYFVNWVNSPNGFEDKIKQYAENLGFNLTEKPDESVTYGRRTRF